MTITIGKTTFDHSAYDEEGDVLYLHVGEPRAAAESDETPERHVIRLDEDGQVIGLTIINVRWLLDREGAVTVSLPERSRIEANELEPALAE